MTTATDILTQYARAQKAIDELFAQLGRDALRRQREIALDLMYVDFAKDGVWLGPESVLLAQHKAVSAALAKSFLPPPHGDCIVNIDGGDMILPIADGPWAGHYLSYNPIDGPEKHLRYPEPKGSHFTLGCQSGRYCWWTLDQ